MSLRKRGRKSRSGSAFTHNRADNEVVVIAAEDFRRLKGGITGKALIEAVQAPPHRDIDIEPRRTPLPVRDMMP
jgi:hypothetical protein